MVDDPAHHPRRSSSLTNGLASLGGRFGDDQMGSVDKTLFLFKHGNDTLLVQIYVDDIIFGGSPHALVSKFSDTISREFEMSMMGEFNLFHGL
jgi:hypothetical protein